AVLAAINALQFLGILPFFVGPVAFRTFNFFYALMWGLMVWVYIWLVQMLWRVDPAAWLFLVIVTLFELTLDFIAMLGASTWQDVSVSFLVNGIILLYVMLPGVRNAFGTSRSALGAASYTPTFGLNASKRAKGDEQCCMNTPRVRPPFRRPTCPSRTTGSLVICIPLHWLGRMGLSI